MSLNKDSQVSASVVLDKKLYEEIKKIAKNNKRSVSAQMAFWIEEGLNKEIK
jgi:hypothetical protein